MAVDTLPNDEIAIPDNTVALPEEIDLSGLNTKTVLPSPETAAVRAKKVEFGMPKLGSYSDLYAKILNGEEPDLRNSAASNVDLENSVRKQKVITGIADEYAKTGRAIPSDLFDALQSSDKTSTNPSTVFEKVYGKAYTEGLKKYREDLGEMFARGAEEVPEVQNRAFKKTEDIITKRELVQTFEERVRDNVKEQDVLPWVWDNAKMFSQVYQELKLRGYMGTEFFTKLGLGNSMEEQAIRLFQLPTAEMHSRLETIVSKLEKDNPTLAMYWLNGMLGMSTNEIVLNNLMSLATLTGISTAYKVGSGVVRGAKIANQTIKADKDFIKAMDLTVSPKAAIAEGAGDLKGASQAQIEDKIFAHVASTQNPAREGIEALQDIIRVDKGIYDANPGTSLARELVNRIGERIGEGTEKLLTGVTNLVKVDRLPFLEAAAKYAKQIGESTIAEFRGAGIKDGYIAHRIRKDPLSNTLLEDVIIGSPDGTFWKGPHGDETARVFAEMHFKTSETRSTTFQTGKVTQTGSLGSTYEITAKGTTNRTLSPTELAAQGKTKEKGNIVAGTTAMRSIPGRPESAKTVYLEGNVAKRIEGRLKNGQLPEGVKLVDNGKGEMVFVKEGKEFSFENRAKGLVGTEKALARVGYSADAVVGKHPLEILPDGRINLGEAITKVTPGYTIEAKQNYSIEQFGGYHYIRVTRPLEETRDIVRDLQLATDITKTPTSHLDNFLGGLLKFRTPDEVLSLAQRENRKALTYAPNALLKIFTDEAKDIGKIAKWTFPFTSRREAWKKWNEVVNYARSAIDPVTKEKGYFFKSMQELETHYQQFANRAPTEAEARAYFSFVKLVESDRVLRGLSLYKNKARLGAQQYNWVAIDSLNKQVKSPSFEGIKRTQWPSTDDAVLYTGTHAGQEKVIRGGVLVSQDQYEGYIKAVKEGRMHVIEVYDVEARPFKGYANVGNTRIRYVVTPMIENKPLAWEQTAQKGGSLFDHNYDFYVKQANMVPEKIGDKVRHWYEGDKTFMGAMYNSMGRDVSAKLNEVQKLIREGKLTEAEAYTARNFPIEWEKLYAHFQETKDAAGNIIPARFGLHEPFYSVPKGKLIKDLHQDLERRYTGLSKPGRVTSEFADGTREGSLARQHQVQYTGQRDDYEVFSFKDKGTKNNPVYDYEPAKYLDPMAALQRGMSRIVNSAFLDDYKIFSVEHWLREAVGNGDPLKAIINASPEDVRRSPMYYFKTAMENLKSGGDAAQLSRMRAGHYQIEQLLGVKSRVETELYSMVQKLADNVYGAYGPNKLSVVASWALPHVKDPFSFVKGMTFHAKLGIWNVPQLVVQAQTFATIMGIAGIKYAAPGTKASLIHRWASVNSSEAVLDHLDSLAGKLQIPGSSKWRPGEWKEAYKALLTTGFDKVAGEYAARDADFSHKIISSGTHQILDSGTWFFREGERQVRLGAWYTAFREFRDKVPTGRLTEANTRAILERADILSVNMSRASSSALHQGVFSLPTQFLAYQLRSAELFMGKRLTPQEKYRLLVTYGTLYGFPAALGVTGLPLGDILRKDAQDQGYIVGKDYWKSLIYEGAPSLIFGMATGKYLNIGDRYAVQGFDAMREAFRGDKTVWDILGGASFGMFREVIESSDGYFRRVMSLFRDQDEKFQFTAEHALRPFRAISSVSAADRMWTAINTTRWISKKGMWLDDASPAMATFQTMVGLQSQQASSAYLSSETIKDRGEYNKRSLDLATQDWRRGLLAEKDGDKEQAKAFYMNSMAILKTRGYPEDQLHIAFASMSDDSRNLISKIDWDLVNKDTHSKEYLKQLQILKNKLQIGNR